MDEFWNLAREEVLGALCLALIGGWLWTIARFLRRESERDRFEAERAKVHVTMQRQIQESLEINRRLAESHAQSIREHHGLLERCLDHLKSLPERVASLCQRFS